MKNYSLLIVIKFLFKFNFNFICLFIFFSSAVLGQAKVTKVFEKEIEVDDFVSIESNMPTSIGLSINGTMCSNNTIDRYTINGKNNHVRLSILKDLNIITHDSPIVKQVTKVTVKASTDEEAQKILEQLNLNLKQGADKRILIDCNLNIETFVMKNGLFRSDNCKVLLDDGNSYELDYLNIETELSIPKSSHVSFKGQKNATIRIGALEGDIDLELKYAEVYGVSVRNLRASLRSCYNVYFDEVESADISSSNSYVDIKKANIIKIGSQSLNDACKIPGLIHKRSNSAQTKYNLGVVEELSVYDSTNDEILISEVGSMKVNKTAYTDSRIEQLSSSLYLDAKSSDLYISEIKNSFKDIDIKNSLSRIDLTVEKGTDYTLNLNRNKLIEINADRINLSKKGDEGISTYKFGSTGEGGVISVYCDKCKFDIKENN